MNEQHPVERQYEGPARLEQDRISETDLNSTLGMGSNSRRDMLNDSYGAEGVGWEAVQPEVKTRAQLEDRRIGRELLKIVVTPDGDNKRASR